MNLVLSGDMKTMQLTIIGMYYLAKDNFNGFPYWEQDDGANVIGFQKSWHTGWAVGHKHYLGLDNPSMIGPNEVTTWPTNISYGFKYWDGTEWQSAEEESSMVFEDCKYFEF